MRAGNSVDQLSLNRKMFILWITTVICDSFTKICTEMTLPGVVSPVESGLMLALNRDIKLKDVYLGLGIQTVTMKYSELAVLVRFTVHGLRPH